MTTKKPVNKTTTQHTTENSNALVKGGSTAMDISKIREQIKAKSATVNLRPTGPTLPRLSIKGRRWSVTAAGETKEFDTFKLNVAIINIPDSPLPSRAFYSKAYTPGGDISAPDCWSRGGIVPDPFAPNKQHDTCNGCPQAVWGSRISVNNKKIPACSQFRLAVVAIVDSKGQFTPPMLLQIPATSMKGFTKYKEQVEMAGSHLSFQAAQVSFQSDLTYPLIDFDFTQIIFNDEQLLQIAEYQDMQDVLSALKVEEVTAGTIIDPVEEQEDAETVEDIQAIFGGKKGKK